VPPLDPSHQSEFGTVASWSADALGELDEESLIAGACRGSASPAALAWLAECLALDSGEPLLDVGAGLGGPAAWVADHYGVVPTAVEPMFDAAHGGRTLFGLSTAVASATHLPLRGGAFRSAWMLGVLDTLPDPGAVLGEVRRVLADDGRLALLAYIAQGLLPEDAVPSGNHFQTIDELLGAVEAAGFAVIDRIDATALPPPPMDWQVRQDRLRDRVAEEHGDDPRHQDAEEQARRFGALLGSGALGAVLLHVVCI
jgi:SAM-dependent methyltransferase